MNQGVRAFALRGLITLFVVACSGAPPYLAVLEADPMASYEAEELELFNVIRIPYREDGFITGGDSGPHHLRQFKVTQREAAEALASAVAVAEANNWVGESDLMPDPTEERFIAAKDLGVGRGRLTIVVDRDPEEFDDPNVAVLTISLAFSGLSDPEDN